MKEINESLIIEIANPREHPIVNMMKRYGSRKLALFLNDCPPMGRVLFRAREANRIIEAELTSPGVTAGNNAFYLDYKILHEGFTLHRTPIDYLTSDNALREAGL